MIFFDFFYGFLGAVVGSFTNVLIHRLPRNEDFVKMRSHCPSCQRLVPWYLNIPLVSYLFLRGRCRYCQAQISPRYVIVELVCFLMGWHLSYSKIDLPSFSLFLVYMSIFSVFVAHFFIDLKYQLLLDKLNIYLALIFLAISLVSNSWSFWLLGGLLGFGIPWIVTWIFYKLKGKVGLGGGDIKLYGALGIYLGPFEVIQNIFFSCLLGSIFGLVLIGMKRMSRDNPIPFGPFIIIVATIQIFFNQQYRILLGHLFASP